MWQKLIDFFQEKNSTTVQAGVSPQAQCLVHGIIHAKPLVRRNAPSLSPCIPYFSHLLYNISAVACALQCSSSHLSISPVVRQCPWRTRLCFCRTIWSCSSFDSSILQFSKPNSNHGDLGRCGVVSNTSPSCVQTQNNSWKRNLPPRAYITQQNISSPHIL